MANGYHCKIELTQDGGISIVVEMPQKEQVQKIFLDGSSILLEVQKGEERSTFLQDEKSVKITCKNLVIEAETIQCTSKKSTQWKSEGSLEVESRGDMDLKSQGHLQVPASQKVRIQSASSGVELDASAGKVSSSSLESEWQSATTMKIKGLEVELQGEAEAKISAPIASVSAEGMMELKGNIANVEGTGLLSLQGGLVQLG